ncbi:MAG: histidine kinase [Saprospiraceae bacterium]|nr:histidine kinase [Lewinella sp.]
MSKIPTHNWTRYVLPFLLALFFGLLITIQSWFREPIGWAWYGLIWMTTVTYIIWESNLRISRWLNDRLNWNRQFYRRLFVQLLLSYLISTAIFVLSFILLNTYETQVLRTNNALSVAHLASSVVMGFMLTTFMNIYHIGYQILQVREEERLLAERYQRESISARLESLRQQIDPHFLFNNFSTLYGLIFEDQERAGAFLLKLSDIYRLVLQHLDRELVSVDEELKLIHAYCDLLAIRYGAALEIDIDLPEKLKSRQIIPFALQLLVENAIKHNQIETVHPLQIWVVYREGEGICVANNVVPRSSVPLSAGIGLKNLEERYRHRLGRSIAISRDRRQFAVIVPLLQEGA